ncbi:ceramide glucosyltransferase-like [Pomacea canaliculata]|uniref:ceramide glucosyltransferase-like n=1 Tax=Pomacea canaliculata TaxID=400727 RepID=UPI000D735A97|nr:ceramide glucosyltransferase-like [Pomacea canaliculata]
MSVLELATTVVALVACIVPLPMLVMHLVALCFGVRFLYKKVKMTTDEKLPGVSIIKPLSGVDPNLTINLDSFFRLNYPLYELLFSVEDEKDPAILVVNSLISNYPRVDARLFVGVDKVGLNGKVNNMMKPYKMAKHNLLLISDSNIKMGEMMLKEMVAEMTPEVGMVLQIPFSCTRKGFAALYEQMSFGTMQARSTLNAAAMGFTCATGMSCLFRRDVLDQAGGLAPYGKYLAEDYFMAKAIREQGYKVITSPSPCLQNSGHTSITNFNNRLIRWGKLRTAMLPHLIVLEPLSECVFSGALLAWAVDYLTGFSGLTVFLLHALVWLLFDYCLFCIMLGGPLRCSKLEFLVAWILREMMVPYIVMKYHIDPNISWRGKRYRLKWGGEIAPSDPTTLQQVTVV